MHRLLNPFGFAAGQLAVFQGASEAPIPRHFMTAAREPNARRIKNGAGRAERAMQKNSQPAAALGVALKMGRRLRCSSVRIALDMRPPRALPAAHFERNEALVEFRRGFRI